MGKSKYAIELKEEKFLIWKIKMKWKPIAEINIKYNIITMEIKLTN
jgi:hypothetical protein